MKRRSPLALCILTSLVLLGGCSTSQDTSKVSRQGFMYLYQGTTTEEAPYEETTSYTKKSEFPILLLEVTSKEPFTMDFKDKDGNVLLGSVANAPRFTPVCIDLLDIASFESSNGPWKVYEYDGTKVDEVVFHEPIQVNGAYVGRFTKDHQPKKIKYKAEGSYYKITLIDDKNLTHQITCSYKDTTLNIRPEKVYTYMVVTTLDGSKIEVEVLD